MDFLKSTISKALGPQLNLPFNIGTQTIDQDPQSIWTRYAGTRKDDQHPVTVLSFDMKRYPEKLALARNALKKARTIRYPDCIRFIDGIETENRIIIGIECAEPLQSLLFKELDLNLVRLGLFKLASTLKFLGEDCQMVHGDLSVNSVWVTRSGEWKLGNFEFLTATKEEQSMIKNYGHLLPIGRLKAPELERSSDSPTTSVDAFSFGCLIYKIFNGNCSSYAQLEIQGAIPAPLYRHYKLLVSSEISKRSTISQFLKATTASNGYFNDTFIHTSIFMEQFALKDKVEKDDFLLKIEKSVDSFPIDFCKYKILPELVHSLEFGGAGSKGLKPILTISGRLGQVEFDELLTPTIIKLFKSTDRSIRLALCEKMDSYLPNLSDSVCNDDIYPNLANGFLDNNAIIREQTLKAVAAMAPKLKQKTINNSLLRYLAKLQIDPEPGIRTNTTVCLVKLSKYFDESVKSKVLIQAFLRSLHDPFSPARKAGLMGIGATLTIFSAGDLSQKILPSICPLLMDTDRTIRDQTFSTVELILKCIRTSAASLPAIEIIETESTQSIAGKEGWASWAISTVSTGMSNAANLSTSEGESIATDHSIKSPITANILVPTKVTQIPLKVDDIDGWGSTTTNWDETSWEEPKTQAAEGWDNDDWAMDVIKSEKELERDRRKEVRVSRARKL